MPFCDTETWALVRRPASIENLTNYLHLEERQHRAVTVHGGVK